MPGKAASRSSTDGNAVNGDTANTEATIKARLSRKRTKTGCLTCRKRRIKCGEERPMCKNCIKSRRHCEGYIQRVVFKQPTFEYIHQYGGDTPFALHNTSESIHNASNQPTTPLAYPNNPTLVAQHYYTSGTPAHEFTQPYTVPITNTTQIPFRQISPHTQHDLYQQIPAFVPPLPHTTVPATTSFNATSNLHQSWQNHAPDQWSTSQAPFPSLVPVDSAVYHDYWHLSPTGDTTKQESGSNVLLDKSSPSAHSESRSLDFAFADEYRSAVFHPDVGPTQMLRAAAVEIADDDYFDVQSDDEMDVDSVIGHKQAGERQDGGVLSIVQQLNAVQQMQLRSYDTFLSQGMLDTYRPEMVANPLRNEATGRVFLHFISATGPSLSPFERNTTTSATLFNNIEVPVTQRGIWTYTMPMAALHNQGLLHAMLALASLHIARLQGGSITPSIQHYAWSLKRIHNAVANKKKRLQLTTIAASMLLGFYEIMTAEHSKWNTHLAGAKQLILETDFAGMLRQFDTLKQHRRARLANGVYKNEAPSVDDITLDSIPDIDESTVSQFFGQEVRYAQQGFVQSEWTGSLPRLDLSKFEILKDLFWWYCKQDAYQSIISGNPLLMDYSRWAECPPRAPIGRVDAVYGSFDHLTLLLGRVADFGAKDKIRKLRDMELNGGTWKPHPASKMARAAPPSTKVPAQTAPLFFGMAPAPTSKVRMPSSYKSLDGQISPSFEKESWDIETALAEHDRIRKALADFRSSLGPAFEPVYENGHAPPPTAFGPPLIYRTYDIGCLMAIYNMTVIIAIRSHPYYHPAAHVAAGMAARDTAVYANDVGRIAAGIVPGPLDVPVNPNLGAALVESCMPSFFAAVQYQQADQRYETVSRIFNIARRTGWGTADLIANGCETSWVRAAEAGRGPPYERIVRSQLIGSSDSRLTGDYELQDPNGQPDEHDQVDRRFVKEKAVARLHWAIGIMGTENDI